MTIGADLALSLAGSIVYDGTKRAHRSTLSMLNRRAKIVDLLSHQKSSKKPGVPDPRSDPAFKDVIRVLGHQHGAYTESTGQFLDEVRRSGVPEAMYDFAICDADPSEIFPAFDLIYKSFDNLPFDSRALFDALFCAIKSRFENSVQDPALLDAVRSMGQDLTHRLSILSSSLAAAKNQTAHKASRFRELRLALANSTEQANSKLPIETNEGPKKVSIKSLVVGARLRPTNPASPETPTARNPSEPALHHIDFRRSVRRAVILGDPGGGKSTLTQLLCYSLAQQLVLESKTPLHPEIDSRDLRLPLKIILRNFDNRKKKNAGYSIVDYLVDEIRHECDNDRDVAQTFILQLLVTGGACVVFDGLDEILDVKARRDAVELIEAFSRSYSACSLLVTSRVVGYKDAPLPSEFEAYVLSRFNRDEVTEFSVNLIREVGGLSEEAAKEEAGRFVEQTETVANDLRANPLMLGLMVYLFLYKGDVPDNRPEIYKECSLLMFEKWDKNRGIIFEIPTDFELLDLFSFLAERIWTSPDIEEGVGSEWLKNETRAFFSEWYEDKARAVSASKQLVDFITGRAWVMCEAGPGVYKFTHRTFLEYFVARRLEADSDNVQALLAKLTPHISRAEWDVVAQLALQIATYRNGSRATRACDALLSMMRRPKLDATAELNILAFASKTLEHLSISESKLKDITREIFERAIRIGESASSSATTVVAQLFYYTSKRADVVRQTLVDVARVVYEDVTSPRRPFVLHLLSLSIAGLDQLIHGYPVSRQGEHIIGHVFVGLKKDVEGTQKALASTDVEEARSYALIYGAGLSAGYQQHGPLFFFPQEVLTRSPSRNLLVYWAIRISIAEMEGERLPIEAGDAIKSIRALAKDAIDDRLRGYSQRRRLSRASSDLANDSVAEYFRFCWHVLNGNRSDKPRASSRIKEDLAAMLVAIMVSQEVHMLSRKRRAPRDLQGYAPKDVVQFVLHELSATTFGTSFAQWSTGDSSFIT